MKTRLTVTLWLGIITAGLVLISATASLSGNTPQDHHDQPASDHELKQLAFEILNTKCNNCHRKQNPFMVFKKENMSRRARKIYKMVFVERKMPKGNEIRLTNEEYLTLEKWLKTQKIY